jgi:hypothetical protein
MQRWPTRTISISSAVQCLATRAVSAQIAIGCVRREMIDDGIPSTSLPWVARFLIHASPYCSIHSRVVGLSWFRGVHIIHRAPPGDGPSVPSLTNTGDAAKTEYGEKLLLIALVLMVAASCMFFLVHH